MTRLWPAWLFLILLGGKAGADALVTSARPDSVSVTIYRAPYRFGAIDADNPEGFALITERRTVTLPAGAAVIRFEGVAGNILPESAVIADLPRDVIEKNLDADLLSPRTLYDRMLGRRVVIRRTDKATGKTIEQQATIRSSADGAALLEIGGGIEALHCTGLNETLVYPGVPDGLSAKPTLSIRTDSPRPVTATMTLSYLSGGFDWQADYVVTMRPDGRSADLVAWVTLASSDVTSFPDAHAMVVAGRLNRVDDEDQDAPVARDQARDLKLHCYPSGAPQPVPPPPPQVEVPIAMETMQRSDEVVVTGTIAAKQEELGDLKLYRFPERVTVASQAQKQVAFLQRSAVPMRALYVSDIFEDQTGDPKLLLHTRNHSSMQLGVPLPAGEVKIFEPVKGRPILIGSTRTDDKAVGEDVEYRVDAGPGVSVAIKDLPGKTTHRHVLTVTNANPWPVDYEASFQINLDQTLQTPGAKMGRKNGRPLWTARVPANGKVVLKYTIVEREDEDD